MVDLLDLVFDLTATGSLVRLAWPRLRVLGKLALVAAFAWSVEVRASSERASRARLDRQLAAKLRRSSCAA